MRPLRLLAFLCFFPVWWALSAGADETAVVNPLVPDGSRVDTATPMLLNRIDPDAPPTFTSTPELNQAIQDLSPEHEDTGTRRK